MKPCRPQRYSIKKVSAGYSQRQRHTPHVIGLRCRNTLCSLLACLPFFPWRLSLSMGSRFWQAPRNDEAASQARYQFSLAVYK